jgi:glycerophosphoryl diester phosphodiesterase
MTGRPVAPPSPSGQKVDDMLTGHRPIRRPTPLRRTPRAAPLRQVHRLAALALVMTVAMETGVGAQAARPTTQDMAGCIRDRACHRTWVAAHRAEGFGRPGNSLAAVTAAIAAGVPVVEIDLRQSSDGEIYVFHDGKLDVATTSSGRFERQPATAVDRARLHNGEPLPRFPDVYQLTRGRALLSVDFKADVIEPIADWIHAHGSFDDLIFFVNTGEEMATAARVKRRYPRMMVMVRLLDSRVTVESTRAVFGALPEIFHTDTGTADIWRLLARGQVAQLHALGVKVYVNALPVERRWWPPFRGLAIDWLLRSGVDFVLSGDAPAMMRRVDAAGRR